MRFELVVILVQAAMVACLPGGAPPEACVTMTPQHNGASPKINANSPYTVSVSSTTAAPGSQITVTISATPPSTQYRGILLQARAGSSTVPSGVWSVDNLHKILRCSGQPALTHNSKMDKNLPKTFTWTAPDPTTVTTYTIYMTIVQKKTSFYVKLQSPAITVTPRSGVVTTNPLSTTMPPSQSLATITMPTTLSQSNTATGTSRSTAMATVMTSKSATGSTGSRGQTSITSSTAHSSAMTQSNAAQSGGTTMKMDTTSAAPNIKCCAVFMALAAFAATCFSHWP